MRWSTPPDTSSRAKRAILQAKICPIRSIESPGQRLSLRMQCMVKLQGLLPIYQAEQRIDEAEQKLVQFLAVIQRKAPLLFPGFMDTGQTGWVDSNKGGMARQAARGWSDGPKG